MGERKLLERYSNIAIYDSFPYKEYVIETKEFSIEQRRFIDFLTDAIKRSYSLEELKQIMPIPNAEDFAEAFNSEIIQPIEVKQLLARLPDASEYKQLHKAFVRILEEFLPEIKDKEIIANEILGNSIGYGFLTPLIIDDNLEEIMVNGRNKPVFVFHKRYGICRTNITIENENTLYRLILRIANTIGKTFDENNPLLDARLPGGSRVNATYKSVTPFGYTLTIRKFNRTPLSIIQLIKNRTLSAQAAAFLWLAVEGLKLNPLNMIISGGAGSGKTTLLNALTVFIRPEERIITIEDTLELDLGERENWIQLEARPKIQDMKEVTMDDLLKNSLRMRPDRIIVGEVRGEEALTMFVAMDTGHRGLLGTLHSNTAREMVLRLRSQPMNVPANMIPLLDLAVIMFKMYTRKAGLIRRVREIAEIDRMEEKILLSNVFEWNKERDIVERTDVPARTLDKFAQATGLTKSEIMDELNIRESVLQWMLTKQIESWQEVQKIINDYYRDPKALLKKVFRGI